MPKRQIKFRLAIEKIAFEFEGDEEVAHRVQYGITRTLESIATIQGQALGMPEKPPVSQPMAGNPGGLSVLPGPRRKRRRREVATGNNLTEASAQSQAGSDPSLEQGRPNRQRRARGDTARSQLVRVRETGFFGEPRTIGDIKEQLAADGHLFESPELSSVLLALTKKQVLLRQRNQENAWIYARGPNNDY
jgi:hypothetical protein